MNKIKLVFLGIILLSGLVLIAFLVKNKNQTRYKSSLAPAFQLVGKSTKSLNTILTKVLPIDELDEADYGVAIKARYLLYADTTDADYIYLNQLIENLSVYSKKSFDYQVFLDPTSIPNAYAMPGGVIVVTHGFLEMVDSEDELVSVLGHEMGHIELGHCFSHIKFELALKKMRMKTLGQIADFCVQVITRSSFNKTQENESDEYGYKMLLETDYNPLGMHRAFEHLYSFANGDNQDTSDERGKVLQDYYRSHPPTALRADKFLQNGQEWWDRHPTSQRYNGKRNFSERISLYSISYEEEWVQE